jgi:DivIVA domain-containing protein
VPIKPEEIDASALPIALRGYQREAVDELLKRVAWDYRQATRDQARWAEEERRLKDKIAELEEQLAAQHQSLAQALAKREAPEAAEEAPAEEAPAVPAAEEQPAVPAAQEQPVALAQTDVEELVRQRTAAVQEELERLRQVTRRYELRDELIKAYLVTSERTARELRSSAREDAEAIVKAARRRAAEIERQAKKSVRNSSVEVERLRRLEDDLKKQLQRTLQAVIGENGSHAERRSEAPLVQEPPEAEPTHEPEPEHWPPAGLD